MNDKESKVKRYEIDVKDAQSRLRECRSNLTQGYLNGQAQIEQAKAVAERDYSRLKEDVIRAENSLAKEKILLEQAIEELERGFDIN